MKDSWINRISFSIMLFDIHFERAYILFRLDNVIDEMVAAHSDVLKVVRLEKNVGLGNALNQGIQHCKNDLVARMDSDDIARPDRCARQLAVFEQKPDIGMVSGIVEEFTTEIGIIDARRVLPEKHEDILEFAKKRNPFNHPCMMYKKDAVEDAGGYQDLFLLEDYFLWIRMLLNGTHGYNLQEPLLWMRAGEGMYKRRSGWKYAKAQMSLFSFMREKGIVSNKEWLLSCIIRIGSSLAPNWIRKKMFAFLWLWQLVSFPIKKIRSGALKRDVRSEKSAMTKVTEDRIAMFRELGML